MKRPKTGPAMWHLMGRGSRRLEIFRDDEDCGRFLRIFQRASEKWEVPVHAYVLMGNHYHFLVTASSRSLGSFMHSINQSYSRGYNSRYELKGRLLDGPYLGFPQGSPLWAVRTSLYIHRNPVAAGLAKKPQDYRWSSCRAFLGAGDAAVSPEPVLRVLSRDMAEARRVYRDRLEEWKDTEWKLKSAPTAEHVWEDQARWLVEAVRKTGADGERDPRPAAAWLARRAGVPLRAIARSLGYSDSNYANVVIHRMSLRLRDDSRLAASLQAMI